MKKDEICKNCRFFILAGKEEAPSYQGRGFCRRYPERGNPSGTINPYQTCGEFVYEEKNEECILTSSFYTGR